MKTTILTSLLWKNFDTEYAVYRKLVDKERLHLVGERCNITGEYFERGSTSEYKIVTGYRTFAGACVVNENSPISDA